MLQPASLRSLTQSSLLTDELSLSDKRLATMETWKDIPGYEGLYQASDAGRIRTVEGKVTSSAKAPERHWKSRILKGRGANKVTGYRVSLWKEGKVKDALVARLVALTFLGEPEEGYTVNHKDGNRFNNSLDNLEWLSRGDNIRYGFENGQYPQKSVTIRSEDVSMSFRSLAACDRYLERHIGYTSARIIANKSLHGSNGTLYEVVKN